jgi:hypothetical protein
MNESAVREQSKAAYKQWAPQWRANAKEHSKYEMKSLEDFRNIGIGRAIVCVANGFSFEENLEALKANRHNVDIMACDKTLGSLIENGIFPDFCIICDANVNYDKYLKPWKDKLGKTVAIINVNANPEWAEKGNWKDQYFFVNKDIIKSEVEFCGISGCKNIIAAGTNVSNAMVIMLTQCETNVRQNFFGYDKILLIGFDYSWRPGGKYYAFNETGDGKAQYMKHAYLTTHDGSWCYTSGNLAFSAEWFETYVRVFNLPVVQCTRKSILQHLKVGNLSDHMKYRYKPEDAVTIRKLGAKLRHLKELEKQLSQHFNSIGREHRDAFLASF